MVTADRYEQSAIDEATGRSARAPRGIPGKGWWQVLKRVARQTVDNNIELVSAGVGFYGLLALFPAIAALISIFGLIADPSIVEQQFENIGSVMPKAVSAMILTQMQQVASGSTGALGLGLAGAILVSLWSATRGTLSLITALNIAYDEHEQRGFFKLNLVALGGTLFLVLLVVIAVAAVVALPIVLGFVGLGGLAAALLRWVRWPLLAAVVLFALAVVYRYGPCRRNARWAWVSWGSVIAMLLWLCASLLFSFYVTHFASYNATYGSIGAVIITLMWLFISAFVVLLGAEFNAELERQTAIDTTYGGEQPMGERGAYVADNLPGDDD